MPSVCTPANDALQRDIEHLLTRPVGRPSNTPVVWYALEKAFCIRPRVGVVPGGRWVAKVEMAQWRTVSSCRILS